MSAPNSIRVTGERRNLPVQRCLWLPSAAVGALSSGQHKDLLTGCLAGPDAGAGADTAQVVAGESPAATPGGPGSPRERPQVPGSCLCSPTLSGPCLTALSISPRVGVLRRSPNPSLRWGERHRACPHVGTESSPMGEPWWELTLTNTVPMGGKEKGPVPLPARSQPRHHTGQ